MAFDFNPITGQLDLVDSPAGYINGVVADSSLLPVTLGAPPLDAVYLAKAGSGLWLIARKPAGMYVRVANNGVAADWTYLGAFPEVNAAANWEVYGSDTTKRLKFNVDGLPTATLRTVDAPAGNGRMLVEGQPIGNTTPAAGTFTTLAANNGTLTASAPVLDLAQTWNNSGVTFTGLRFNATNTASAAASLLADLQVGGTSQFNVNRSGVVVASQYNFASSDRGWQFISNEIRCGQSTGVIGFTVGGGANGQVNVGINIGRATVRFGGTDAASGVSLKRDDAANILCQENLTNPQTFRIYNTFTDASNHERGFMRWSSNVLQIGTEAAGTGSARDIEFQHGGTTRFSLIGNTIRFATTNVSLFWANATMLRCFSNGNLTITTSNQADFGLLQFGGTGSGVPALKRSSTALQVRLADDSAFAPLSCGALTLNGNLDASTRDIVTDTTTGTKIGTATNQKIGFFNATPVVQQAAVADATDAASTQARLNDLLARLRTLGLIAT